MSFCTIAPFPKSCRPNSEILRVVRTVWAPPSFAPSAVSIVGRFRSQAWNLKKPRRSGKSWAVPFFVRVPVCSSGVALSRSSPAHRRHGRSFVIVHSSSFSRDGTKNLSSVWQDVMAIYSMAISIASHSTSGGVAEVEIVFSNNFHHLNPLERSTQNYAFVWFCAQEPWAERIVAQWPTNLWAHPPAKTWAKAPNVVHISKAMAWPWNTSPVRIGHHHSCAPANPPVMHCNHCRDGPRRPRS